MNTGNTRKLLAAGLVAQAVLAAAFTRPADAACAGVVRMPSLNPILKYNFNLPANTPLTIETVNLNPVESDPVIHVFDLAGTFIGGNDDCFLMGSNAACVTVSSPVATPIVIYVRSYSDTTNGQTQLRLTLNGSATTTEAFEFAGRLVPNPGATVRTGGIRVTTTGIQKHATDSILLLLDPLAGPGAVTGSALAQSDDAGFSRMSQISFTGTHGGQIIVGRYRDTPAGDAMVVWDEDALTLDSDGDGLGDCLESTLGTSATNVDTDTDGISDGLEVVGDHAANPPLDLPKWGADPKKLDVFVEADWNPGQQMTTTVAQQFVDFFKEPGASPADTVRVHVDMGVENPNPADHPSLVEWGWWGGANQRGGGRDCVSRTPNRVMFHLLIMGGGRWGNPRSWCFSGDNDAGVLAQELGHNLNMDHGGSTPSGSVNYKPIYVSPMNYAFQSNPAVTRFSTGAFGAVKVKPISLNETTWQGTNSASLAIFQAPPFSYLVSGKGVDWNQDNRIDGAGSPGNGRINWPAESGNLKSNFGFVGETDPALEWYKTINLIGSRLYLVSRLRGGANQNRLTRRYTTDVKTCAFPGPIWSPCATWVDGGVIPGSETTTAGVGLAAFMQGGTRRLMLVYANTNGNLRFQIMTLDGSGQENWTPSVAIGAEVINDAPTAIWSETNRVDVYANSGGALKRWSYNISTSTWDIQAVTQTWSTGGNITPAAGIAATIGWQIDSTSPFMYALFPNGSMAAPQFVRRHPLIANQWQLLTTVPGRADRRPGLVYRPYLSDLNTINLGRFVFLMRDISNGDNRPRIGQSEGNNTNCFAPNRRLCTWRFSDFVTHFDVDAQSSSTLVYDLNLDANVRGAHTSDFEGTTVMFRPLADGLVNFEFRDQNDYPHLKKNAGCSLNGQCFWCETLASDSALCTSWSSTPF
jgi:hypothetical protein